jgi:hypothetical protein
MTGHAPVGTEVTLLSPSDGITTGTNFRALAWSIYPDATGYTFEFSAPPRPAIVHALATSPGFP